MAVSTRSGPGFLLWSGPGPAVVGVGGSLPSWPHGCGGDRWSVVFGGGGERIGGDLSNLSGVGRIGVRVLVGDPVAEFGFVSQERGPLGGVLGSGAVAQGGEVVQELGDVAGGDRRVVIGHDVDRSRSRVPVWVLARRRLVARSR